LRLAVFRFDLRKTKFCAVKLAQVEMAISEPDHPSFNVSVKVIDAALRELHFLLLMEHWRGYSFETASGGVWLTN
jgi:hypothetical protein